MSRSRNSNPDHTRRHNMPAPSNEAIEAHISDLLKPLVHNQLGYYRQLGLRSRILGLPLMVAAVLTLLWRQVPSVRELSRALAREDLLWCKAVNVSQQSLSKRFLEFPHVMFEQVLWALVVQLKRRWMSRRNRPKPASIAWTKQRSHAHLDSRWLNVGSHFSQTEKFARPTDYFSWKDLHHSRYGESFASRHPL